ncbi:flagellar hook-length control protein FliK [Marinomonas sp.]
MLAQSKTANLPSNSVSTAGTVIDTLSQDTKHLSPSSKVQLQTIETLNSHGKSTQLISARDGQNKPFTIINSGAPISLDTQSNGQLVRLPANQASLHTLDGTLKQDVTLGSRITTMTVVDTPKPSTSGYTVQVSDGKQIFTLQSQQKLAKGDSLRVMVDGNNQLQLLPNKLTNPLQTAQLDALKLSLPKQLTAQGMADLISQLQSLSNSANQLTPKAQQALSQLLQHLPSIEKLTASPEGMKQAVQASGVFTESLLKQQHPQLNADLKLNLMRLNQVATEQQASNLRLPTEQIANAIERLTTGQLRHLNDIGSSQSQVFPLHIELPIKELGSQHLVKLDIDQDSANQEIEPHLRRWLVKLQFDLEQTGRFDARAAIQGNKVSVMFAAEEASTQRLLQNNLTELKQKLMERDIEVSRLESFQAKLTAQDEAPSQGPTLIDVRS